MVLNFVLALGTFRVKELSVWVRLIVKFPSSHSPNIRSADDMKQDIPQTVYLRG